MRSISTPKEGEGGGRERGEGGAIVVEKVPAVFLKKIY